MIFSKKMTVYPFSGFEGQLLHNGEPAAFATVTRTYDWDGTLHEETIKADEEGRFSFESVSVEMRQGIAQFSSSQKIFVQYKNEKYQVWVCGKIAKQEFGEFGGKPKAMVCEVTADREVIALPSGGVGTSCSWEVIEDDGSIKKYN